MLRNKTTPAIFQEQLSEASRTTYTTTHKPTGTGSCVSWHTGGSHTEFTMVNLNQGLRCLRKAEWNREPCLAGAGPLMRRRQLGCRSQLSLDVYLWHADLHLLDEPVTVSLLNSCCTFLSTLGTSYFHPFGAQNNYFIQVKSETIEINLAHVTKEVRVGLLLLILERFMFNFQSSIKWRAMLINHVYTWKYVYYCLLTLVQTF